MSDFQGSLKIISNPAVLLYILKGVAFTLVIAVLAVILGILIGSVLAMVRNYCNTWKSRIFKWIAVAYIEIFRNTPLLLWIFICVVFCPCPSFLQHKMLGLTSVEVKLLFGDRADGARQADYERRLQLQRLRHHECVRCVCVVRACGADLFCN